MKFNSKNIYFVVSDIIMSILAWSTFYILRKKLIEKSTLNFDNQLIKGILITTIIWITIYYLQGTYHKIKRHYRLGIFNKTLIGTFVGTILLFFTLLLDDRIKNYTSYYQLFTLLFLCQSIFILLHRLIFVSIQVNNILNKNESFKTIIIGDAESAESLLSEIRKHKKNTGIHIIGFVSTDKTKSDIESVECLGNIENIKEIIQKYDIEDIILTNNKTIESKKLLSQLSLYDLNIKVKIDEVDISSSIINQNNIFGLLLDEFQFDVMPFWQQKIKRVIDILISLISLIFLIPFLVLIAIGVKRSSKGPIFFLQERIGLKGRPFNIIKFRTMYLDSEKNGPQLSSSDDDRITRFGKYLRKTRIDEFPQFINVLKGDMSLVGPRPERQFYINQIVEKDPYYLQLSIIRPGITSWGQVKYGYAENVEQMVQRMKFDLLYLKNRSLALDFKIMFYTLITILKAKGK